MKRHRKVLFIFRRDLRLEDNSGLIYALQSADEVIPCFIFAPEQVLDNPYKSGRCLQFMLESLSDLEESLQAKHGRLFLFFGIPEEIVAICHEKLNVEAVFVNRDYTPYSIKRDQRIEQMCSKCRIPFYSCEDALLHAPEKTVKANKEPYTIFTPFFRHASKIEIPFPCPNPFTNYYKKDIPFACSQAIYQKILPHRFVQQKGGRKEALKILKNLKRFANYKETKDFPAVGETTHLSAHLKFTTCSIREAYHAIKKAIGEGSELIRSLYWRDFFTAIAFFFPTVFQGAFHRKFDLLEWNSNEEGFQKWCEGITGFPIVDAGMRELSQTGYLSNRLRMIVASFLVKDLYIDWRLGEKFFARTLIDYDPSLNNGNWQWVASTGCDSQPYYRVFNPWIQALKFDRDCLYIKKWVPELAHLPPKIIHGWHLAKHQAMSPSYPLPIVDHAKEAKLTVEAYKKLLKVKIPCS